MKMKRLISFVIVLLLVCGMPVSAFADTWYVDDGNITVNATDSGQTVSQGETTTPDDAPVITQRDSSTPTTNTVTINAEENATANVTLDGVNIDTRGTHKAAVEIQGEGDVVIELDGSNTVQSGWERAGVEKNTSDPWGTNPGSGNGNLTITDENETHGSLKATGGSLGAGIGGGHDRSGSNLTITGNAEVTAQGGYSAAGIGGGDDNDGRNITISGNAEVIAIGGGLGAGIGGGSACGDGSYITIEGNAKVTAKGGDYAAGIGGGESCDGSNITITGSAEVTATGGSMGAGIGGGACCTGSENITVSGDAQVKAQGGVETNNPATGAAIGDGAQYNSDIPGREETPNTDALNEGWIAAYAPGTENMDTAVPNSLTYKDDNGYLTTSSNAVPFTKQKPTCTEDGYRAGFTVGNTQVGGETLPATGHNVPNGYTPQNDATCTTLGTMKGYCPNCQTTVTIPDPNSEYAPHSFTNYISNPDATYDHDGTKTARCDFCDATDTIPDPGSKLVWATAPLYRVIDQDGKDIPHKAERKDGVLTVTVDADFASLTGSLGGINALKEQGIDTIVFITNGASSAFALSDLLAQGSTGDIYTLNHNGDTVSFTLGEAKTDINEILAQP
ncbi:MAG: hypothetical protein SPE93_07755 [Candidatus Limivicinus sp.]|nr:hypothetical protein [Candidatus Limivicinus sp.]